MSLCRRLTSRTVSNLGGMSDAVGLLFAAGPITASGGASLGGSGVLIAVRRLTVLAPPISSDAQRSSSAFRPCRLRVAVLSPDSHHSLLGGRGKASDQGSGRTDDEVSR